MPPFEIRDSCQFHTEDTSPNRQRSQQRHPSFAGDILKLATGTAASQLIGVLAAPLIAHLFAPSAFGTLAIFTAIAGVVSVISCFRYEVAIYLPEKDEEASQLVILCLFLVVITTCVTLLLTRLFGSQGLRLIHVTELKGYLWLLPLNVFIAGVSTILNTWNARKLRFGRITAMQVVMRIAITASQIIFGFSGFVNGVALIITTTFGIFVTCAILSWQTLCDDWQVLGGSVSWKASTYPWRRYYQFPRFGLAATVLNSTSFSLPSILLSSFFSTTVAGLYSFGLRVLRVPGILIGTNFDRAFFPRAAEAKLRGALGSSVEQALQYLITLSFFPCFLLTLTGGDLFRLFFGARWQEAGVYSQILSVWLFFWFISSPLNTVFVVLEDQKLELRFQIVNIVTRFFALLIGGLFGNARLAIALFAISGVGVYGAYCLAVIRKSGAAIEAVQRVALSRIALFVPVLIIFLGLKLISAPPAVITGMAIIILIIYYWHVLRSDPRARRAVKRFVNSGS
ncbi:MAG: oligosaccharide flippase family protein [Nitrososphaerota archaeon]|nr:oligosaccharide flippase family protein [Nitrososphaerota archaeon]